MGQLFYFVLSEIRHYEPRKGHNEERNEEYKQFYWQKLNQNILILDYEWCQQPQASFLTNCFILLGN